MEPPIAEETDPPQEKEDVSVPDEEKESVSVPEKEEEVCVKEEEECVKEKPPPKKRGPPKQPKVQCTICLRYYSMKRVVPGGHANCVPPVKKDTAPPQAEEPPLSRQPPPREDRRVEEPPDMSSSFIAPATAKQPISKQDVVRFLASERMSRHARRAERWHQQMFG